LVLFFVACLLISSAAFAQDPGLRDSLIIKGATVIEGWQGFVAVQIFAVTDDTVMTYNLPITWNSPTGQVNPGLGTTYFPPLTQWADCFDSVVTGGHFIRQFGICDLGDTMPRPPLRTNGQRINAWTLHFFLSPGCPPQVVSLDTTYDDRLGSMYFGLIGGLVEFAPAVRVQSPITILPDAIEGEAPIPFSYALNQNYPNPFNPETNIEFSLPKDSYVSLTVYNLLGQQVRNVIDGNIAAGVHTALWDGRDESGAVVPSGVYFYKLYTPEFSQTNKMTLLR
jgi:hypothetical protein